MNTFFQKVKKALKWRLRYWALSHVMWVWRQRYAQWRMRFLSQQRREHILKTLPEEVMQAGEWCAITITFGARQLGNRDNLIEGFLNTFLRMTEDPRRVEILIKVDFDDDLLFFYRIKQQYGPKINLRFFPSERGRGYADVHLWHEALIQKKNPNSRALIVITEDAEFIYKHWDRELMARMDAMVHPYFIATPCSLEEAIMTVGPNPAHPVPVYWIRGADFPIWSFFCINITGQVALKHTGWTCLGDSVVIDVFSGGILKSLWLRHKVNCHMRIPQFFQRRGIMTWSESPQRSRLRTRTLLDFFLEENQQIRDEMADAIAGAASRINFPPPVGGVRGGED